MAWTNKRQRTATDGSSAGSAGSAGAPHTSDSSRLGSGLQVRHLTMMGLGSAIGAGLFLGTGVGIQVAGPSVLLAYIVAGLLVIGAMQMLGEMGAARPASGSFSVYAEMAFGRWAGFYLGWLYWFMLIMVLGAEMTGASAIMASWFGVDPWIPALVCVVFFAVVNLMQVKGFGEFEFWFAFIKVAVIGIFLFIGVLLIFGLLPGTEYIGAQHIRESGFLPNGLPGLAAGLLAVAFAFGGIEIVTIAAAESADPVRSISLAVRSTIWRISVFYLGSVLVICFLLPFGDIAGADTAAESPFTRILAMANIPGVVGIMEVVIVLALLSAFNAQIYASSRLAYSLATRDDAPAILGVTNRHDVPMNSVILSMIFAFVSVGLQFWNPPGLLEFLLNAVGGILIVVWGTIALSWIKLHPQFKASGELTEVHMPGHPYTGWATFGILVVIVILMLFDAGARQQLFALCVMSALILFIAFITGRWSRDSEPRYRKRRRQA
ncbi:amino acid permease [Corynebacterium glucuronolyticum]|uniref:Amino acid permease n=1 Tax=Corynebacterium glucuronolyticum TaxID=39791 RepID=A0AAX1LB54_9CORY|nr:MULTISPECIES: amino acid permease [Corynebacterium]QRO83544.1 amino acid permease [Corynebacterium glucuronolyticum]QRP71453.1 amino acid permease [Corynebacterium glucuronolyticum]